VAQALPNAPPLAILTVAQALAAAPYEGQANLRELARAHVAHAWDTLPIAEALQTLGFAEVKDGRIRLTAGGRVFAEASHEQRKRLFKEHLIRFVPLAAHIQTVLQERKTGPAPRARFESELEDTLSRGDAIRTLRTVIGWGRYAELFDYDDRRRMFRAIKG
jgi:NitT/TauT family transport system ATP-binding protein